MATRLRLPVASLLVVLLALAGCGMGRPGRTARPSDGPAAVGVGGSTSSAGTVSATIGRAGGRLTNRAGVVLEVPKNVLSAPATASIAPKPGGAWDVHIASAWSGTVAVTLPAGEDADRALFGHQVSGAWRVEAAKISHGALTAQVQSLSLFKVLKVLKCLIGTPNPERIARRRATNLARQQAPRVPERAPPASPPNSRRSLRLDRTASRRPGPSN